MKLIAILLLGLGLIPVIVKPFDIKVRIDDSSSMIKYKMEMKGLTMGKIARGLNLSETYVMRNISKNRTTRLEEIIKFINKSKVK